ncbi:MAG: prepilin-type N-terminal cleavage/methylation domain-containing protein [Verrucomicrobiota bacterium]
MTSAVKTPSRSLHGFTLIEIVMVLAIAAVLLGGAVTIMVFATDERDLRKTSGQVELLARRARTISILQQIPYALEFRPGVVRLLPFAEAGQEDTKKTVGGHSIGGERVVAPSVGAVSPVHDQLSFDGKMASFLRRWNTVEWLPMSDRFPLIWRFDPDGLCEPVSVRLTIGSNYIEDTYHPLTASICDTVMEVK